ncbi:restriction endonuclease subunit S [Psychrobium sp. 1_MG-2023]|uniref:restriction endonuclease subunit S n=1 Tax=Psychrobium sp. 1_MG-2023 TaxID=3062624 RepID=UPI002733CF04|nr:restriction endonuclease subunit S [Psychrobium sp. 1_MG-2023]MDP2560417.1 restriction endonuclease subunit S [Psychrobium sp. 1_MG-2023]
MSNYQTLLNSLPSDWETKKISELGTVVSGGTPSRAVSSFWQGNTPWVTPGEVSKLKSKNISSTSEYITDSGLNNSGANLLPEGSLLVTSRATLGARVINQVPMTTNQGFKSIVFEDPKDADYYFHFISLLKAELERRASGTTFLEISGAEFSDIDLPVPPKNERNKINEILDTLDNQINETEGIIAKLQHLKQGLLHDLLTRGVDGDGKLRPSYEDAPELYKSSKLGWIPCDWNYMSIGDAITKKYILEVQDGNHGEMHPKTSDFVKDGVPFVMANDIQNNKVNFEKCYRITEKQYESLRIGFSKANDVLLSHKGTVGQVAIVPDSCDKLMLTPQVTYYRCDTEQLVPQYLSCWFLSSYFKKTLSALSAQSTRAYIGILAQRELPFLYIPKKEQPLIVERYSSICNRYDYELAHLKKLKLEKSGVMYDLLTGKVRTTMLLQPEQVN